MAPLDHGPEGTAAAGVGNGSSEQERLWKGAGGAGWVEAQDLLDATFAPFGPLVEGVLRGRDSGLVLDVGCGTGATTVALARRLGGAGGCVGIDLSEAMIAAARARAERESVAASFVCADAQTHEFEPASFDAVVSRFGVMFFADPVAALANLRGAAADGAELHFVVWRSPAENSFATAAERAAEPLLPGISERTPDAPGQFGWADRDRVRGILAEGGWSRIEVEPVDLTCAFDASQLDLYLTRLGPVGRALQEVDERTREKVLAAVRPAFDPYRFGKTIRFTAACWRIDARAGA